MSQTVKRIILSVDDDEGDRRLVQRALTLCEDIEVISAGSGEEALGLLVQVPVHVIVSDLRLPGIDGLELLTRAQVMQPDAGRLLITADRTVVRSHMHLCVLFKPVNIDELSRSVGQLANMAQMAINIRERVARITGSYPKVPRPQ